VGGKNTRDVRGGGLKGSEGPMGTPKDNKVAFRCPFHSREGRLRGGGSREVCVQDAADRAGIGPWGTRWEEGGQRNHEAGARGFGNSFRCKGGGRGPRGGGFRGGFGRRLGNSGGLCRRGGRGRSIDLCLEVSHRRGERLEGVLDHREVQGCRRRGRRGNRRGGQEGEDSRGVQKDSHESVDPRGVHGERSRKGITNGHHRFSDGVNDSAIRTVEFEIRVTKDGFTKSRRGGGRGRVHRRGQEMLMVRRHE
jgi:hypothetical protein